MTKTKDNLYESELRHGDLSFCRIAEPSDLTAFEVGRDLVLAGSHGGAHVLLGACRHKSVDLRTRQIIVPEPTQVTHADRHLTGDLPAGAYSVVVSRTADGIVED